ncbi:hypothetical protein [Paenibacillus sp. SN-8-1]|uniref:hypothetical protein n=1 Tax=Paenibacillus sp. SN-8-1 TaxID=3435409 RepID=UPI003D9A9F9B
MSKLQEIRKVLEAATEARTGPWYIGAQSPNGCINIGSKGVMVAQCLEASPAALIAHTPEYLSYLLQRVEIQESRLESLNEESMSNFRAAHERGKESKRLRKALEEAFERLCNAQPNTAGFILAAALKEGRQANETTE